MVRSCNPVGSKDSTAASIGDNSTSCVGDAGREGRLLGPTGTLLQALKDSSCRLVNNCSFERFSTAMLLTVRLVRHSSRGIVLCDKVKDWHLGRSMTNSLRCGKKYRMLIFKIGGV
jgi:hypothetical protein